MNFIRKITKSECPKSVFGHKWIDRSDLNARFYHHGALSRKGKMCYHCVKVVFPEANQEYYDTLPIWLKKDKDLIVPSDVIIINID